MMYALRGYVCADQAGTLIKIDLQPKAFSYATISMYDRSLIITTCRTGQLLQSRSLELG